MSASRAGAAQPDKVVIRFTRQIYYEDSTIYQAEVRSAPSLLRGGPFHAGITEQIQRFRALFAQRIAIDHGYKESMLDLDPEAEREVSDLAILGEELYSLLPEALREGLPRILQSAFDKGRGLQLTFETRAGDQSDQLLTLPWEIMYIRELKQHLGLMQPVTIVRRLLDTVRRAQPELVPPFRIAHVIADLNTPYPIDPELLAAEREAVQQAAGIDDYYTLVEHPGSVDRLLDELRRRPYEIVHFLGHGDIDTQFSQQSYLLFAGENNVPQAVNCEQLPNLLSASPRTQIIVLNACHGASVEAANTIAMQLVYNGLPYVVAMQGEVFQDAAAIFARTFYHELQGQASLDQAVAESRRRIAEKLPNAIDWSLPALYVSVGVAEASPEEQVVQTIERWLSLPEGQRQLAVLSISLGATHLAVALLLLLSGVVLQPPDLQPLLQMLGVLVLIPPLLVLIARLTNRVSAPRLPDSAGPFLLRIAGAATIGMGLQAIYAWFTLWLAVGMGFWAILSPFARTMLLVTLFAPGLALGWQQIQGHARGFRSNAEMKAPTLDWQELAVILGGYLMICAPVGLLWLFPSFVAPPLGNLAIGLVLCALGAAIRKELR